MLNGLTTPLSGGETVQLMLTFATAGAVTLQVPVEPAAYEYATYSPPPTPTPSTAAHGTRPGQGQGERHGYAGRCPAATSATP